MVQARLKYLLWVIIFASATVIYTLPTGASQLQNRSISVRDTRAGQTTNHVFDFEIGSTDPLGSIVFEYCESPIPNLPCNVPVGLNTSAATLSNQSGETGFSIYSTTNNQIILTRSIAPANLVPASYDFGDIVNPTATNETFSVRISTYGSIDGTGTQIDWGSVVSSTTQGVEITTEVPPTLQFCVGVTIPTDCASADGYFLQLGELRSNQTRTASSQMMGGTNADFGYIVTASGTTMASGSNEISAMSSRTTSKVGTSQFGINLRANSSPAVGAEPTGTGIATPTVDYSVPNQFKFVNGDIVASSNDETNEVKFTVSYVVNIPNGQAPGIYTSTMTYLCVATF